MRLLPLFAFCILHSAFAAPAHAEWTPHPSDGVEMHLTREGDQNRIDFDFHGHAGYAIARRAVDVDLPANYRFVFDVRGDAPRENLEFKLIDPTGDNVWWINRRDFEFPGAATPVITRKRQIAFAWGPIGGGEIHHVASMEVVVTAGSGGKGTVWFTDPRLEEMPPSPDRAARFHSSAIDFGARRELGGLTIDWMGVPPRQFSVVVDGVAKRYSQTRFVWLPDAEAREIRIEGGSVASVEVEPPAWAPTANDFASIVARAAPRGRFPRYLRGEQPYWTVIGADGADEEALVGEDGNVEPFKSGFSIEPFLVVGGKLVTWADASPAQALAEGDLPVPSVTWTLGRTKLAVTAAVSNSSMLQLHYRVEGSATLLLAIRPFQVNPSTQFLNTTGGVAKPGEVRFERGAITTPPGVITPVEQPRCVMSIALARPDVAAVVARSCRPADDPVSADTTQIDGPELVLVYPAAKTVDVHVPLRPGAKAEPLQAIVRDWRARLHRFRLDIGGAPEIADTVRATVGWTLVERDGVAFEPGSRSYDRAWIRDGSLIGATFLRLGHVAEAKEFAEWFAKFQYDDGKVPCCVDARGADPVPENDSHGEFIFLVAEILRTTGDSALARRLWPNVDAAARFIQKLRSENHGAWEGLVTESISHEGYSSKAVHSYWDDEFCLRGLEDAAWLARALGRNDRADEIAREAASFRHDLQASIARTASEHHLDTIPASAELGDFDPTSTAIAISPLGLTSLFDGDALRRTYARYLADLAKPRSEYTPYEMRIIGALIRLGDRKHALELIDRFLRDRRPAPWKEWAEVVREPYRKAGFIGDMPHAWIASDFTRSILDAIAYDREDGALVVGAGVPARWLPLHAGPIATYHGAISIAMTRSGDRAEVSLSGDAHPPGGIVVVSPFDEKVTKRVEKLPARVPFDRAR